MSCNANPLSWGSCITNAVGGAAKAAAKSAFDQIAGDFAHTAQHATAWLWGQLNQATAVQIGGPGWGTYLGITVTLAAVIGVGLFAIQVTVSALRRDTAGLGRAARGLLVAFVAGAGALGIVELLLKATDSISNGIMTVGLGTSDWESVGHKFAVLSMSSFGSATLLLAALFTCASVVFVWLALMVRKVLLIITAVFAPIAFAGSVSDITAGWVRKWIEYTVALIASKIVLVMIFVVGLRVLMNNLGSPSGGSSSEQVTQLMAGLLVLAVAGLAPWMAVRFVHFTGDAFHTIHSHAGMATAGAAAAVAAPQKVRNMAAHFSGPPGAGGSPPGAPASQAGRGGKSGAAAGTAAGAGAAGMAGAAVAATGAAKKAKDGGVGAVSDGHDAASGSSPPSPAAPGERTAPSRPAVPSPSSRPGRGTTGAPPGGGGSGGAASPVRPPRPAPAVKGE